MTRRTPLANEAATLEQRLRRWNKRQSRLWIGNNSPPGSIEDFLNSEMKHFTPGLWSMLHALSVSQAPHRKSHHEVMTGIREFVAEFFR